MMANTYSSHAANIGQTCLVGLRFGKVAGRVILTLMAAAMACGCSGGSSTTAGIDRPNWDLAAKPAQALGGPSGASAAQVSEPDYEYRGGRDLVTGNVRAGAPAGPKLIEIRKGDTLHGLSLTHHVSVKALMAANNMTSATIRPGQKLVVPEG